MDGKEKCTENIEKLRELTVDLMQRLMIRDRQLVYRYAYSLIVVSKHAGDPTFEKEPMPPADVLHLRVRNLLRDATAKEVKYIFFWAMAKRRAEKNKKE